MRRLVDVPGRALVASFAIACFAAFVPPRPAVAATSMHEQLTRVAEDYVAIGVRFDPTLATTLGIEGHDAELAMPSEATRAAQIARLRALRARVTKSTDGHRASPDLQTSLADRDDAKLLLARIDRDLEQLVAREADRKSYAAPALKVTEALYTQFLNLPVAGRDGATPADVARAAADIVARMERGPAFIVAGQRLVTKPGRLAGIVGARQLAGAIDFLNDALAPAMHAQLAGDPQALRRFDAARDALVRTIGATKTWIDGHAARWPENYAIGKAAYERMLRDHQLLPFDAADIERLGRDTLAHGWAEEAWVTAEATRRHVAFGAASGGGMAPDGAPLVDYYRDRLAELRAFVDTHDVVTVPAWLGTMQIVETPTFLQPVSPGASMRSPRLFSPSTTGTYFITPPKSLVDAAARLDMNEDFDRDRIWQTGAHEAYPGHFFQLSIAHRHPDFIRRLADSASFAEGWAFYGEEMFVRLGLYGDDLDVRLFTARWERVRGARAVVDVRLATGQWTVAEAAAFYEAQSGFTKAASEAAVDGIALEPGYVIAYAAGRLQLQTLLGDYLATAGDAGSLHDFHDRLLSYGTVPFTIVGPELLADLPKPASAVREAANY